MSLSASERNSFLKDEYLLLQNQYEDFDRRSLTIKGWIASGTIAALAIAFNSSHQIARVIPVFVIIICLMVWYLEASWKMFQYALTDRIRLIEAYFRDDEQAIDRSPAPFQIYRSWFRSYSDDEPVFTWEIGSRSKGKSHRLKLAALQPFVSVTYVTMIALSTISILLLCLPNR